MGASIDVDLTIRSLGDIAFTISNIEMTVLQPTGLGRSEYLPVATLLSSKTLITGEPATFNLGPFTGELGPFIFRSREIFPNLVDELMSAPTGLVFQVTNFDLTDEFGRNFAFASQSARDRTVGVTIDFGDGIPEVYFIATNGAIDSKGILGTPGALVGGFNSLGEPQGIPLDFLLQDILKMAKNRRDVIVAGVDGVADSMVSSGSDDIQEIAEATTGLSSDAIVISPGPNGILDSTVSSNDQRVEAEDAINAGENERADTFAAGDDVQLIPPGTTGLQPSDLVVSAGVNGILDTVADPLDSTTVASGYETTQTCNAATERKITAGPNNVLDTTPSSDLSDDVLNGDGSAVLAGPNQIIDTLPSGDDVLSSPREPCTSDAGCPGGACDGGEALVRIKHRRSGDFNRVWVIITSEEQPAGADFGSIIVKPGDDIALLLIQDIDQDGVFATTEFIYGSSDHNDDSDADGISDFAEIYVGWTVGVLGAPLVSVFSDPRVPDGDGDGLEDLEEKDLSLLFDVTSKKLKRCANGDDKGLACSKNASCRPVAVSPEVVCDDDDDCSNQAFCLNLRCVDPINCLVDASGPSIEDVFGPGAADSILSTNPRLADTDQDGISDMEEIAGYNIGVAIKDGGNGKGDTPALGDDIQLVLLGAPVGNSGVVILPGPNGVIDSVPGNDGIVTDDVFDAGHTVYTNPLDPDSDGDTRKDGDERANGGDPTDPNDPDDFKDSDRDGLTDAAEEVQGWVVDGVTVHSNKFTPDTDFDGLPDLLERIIGTNPTLTDTDGDGLSDYDEFADFAAFIGLQDRFPGFVLNGNASLRIGTDPLSEDTDGDGLTDFDEATGGWRVLVLGEIRHVTSSPLFFDTDLDGANDLQERNGEDGFPPLHLNDTLDALDPTDPDTDGDGTEDGVELKSKSNALVPDIAVEVVLTSFSYDLGTEHDITPEPLNNQEMLVNLSIRVPSLGEYKTLATPIEIASAHATAIVTGHARYPNCPTDILVLELPNHVIQLTTTMSQSHKFAMPLGSTIFIESIFHEFGNCLPGGAPELTCIGNGAETVSSTTLLGNDFFHVVHKTVGDDCTATWTLEFLRIGADPDPVPAP